MGIAPLVKAISIVAAHRTLVSVLFWYFLVLGLLPSCVVTLLSLPRMIRATILDRIVLLPGLLSLKFASGVNNRYGHLHAFAAFGINAMDQAIANEDAIDACNESLLEAIAQYAALEDAVHLQCLITRYAWDMMGATTIGHPFGFVKLNSNNVDPIQELSKWKMYSIVYGTYFTFRPWISKVYQNYMHFADICKFLRQALSTQPQTVVSEEGRRSARPKNTDFLTVFAALSDDGHLKDQGDAVTTAMALMLADQDPVVEHILNTLVHLAQNPDSLTKLREEVVASKRALSQPPRANELMHMESTLPFLHAVLLESRSLHGSGDHQYARADPKTGRIYDNDNPVGMTEMLAHPANKESSPCGEHLPMLAFGQKSSNDRIPKALVTKVITQIVRLYDIEMRQTAPEAHSTNKHQQYIVVFKRSLQPPVRSQSVSTMRSDSTWTGEELDDGFTFMRQLIGDQLTAQIFAAADGPVELLNTRVAKFDVLKTDTILDRHARTRFNHIIRILFLGKLDTTTDADKCITIQRTGKGNRYHNENYNGCGRGNRTSYNDNSNSRGRGQKRYHNNNNNNNNNSNFCGDRGNDHNFDGNSSRGGLGNLRGREGRQQRSDGHQYTTIRKQHIQVNSSNPNADSPTIDTPSTSSTSTTNGTTMKPTAAPFEPTPAGPTKTAGVAAWKTFASTSKPAPTVVENTEKKEAVYANFKTTYKITAPQNENWLSGSNRKIISVRKPEDQALTARKDEDGKRGADRQPFIEDE